jgi:hypothetical protein
VAAPLHREELSLASHDIQAFPEAERVRFRDWHYYNAHAPFLDGDRRQLWRSLIGLF